MGSQNRRVGWPDKEKDVDWRDFSAEYTVAQFFILFSVGHVLWRKDYPMVRAQLVLAFSMLAIAAAGCTMCDSPYDYCGPTFTGQAGEPCCPNARAGSVLSPPLDTVGESELAPSETPTATEKEPSPTPAAAPKPQPAPSGRITARRPRQPTS